MTNRPTKQAEAALLRAQSRAITAHVVRTRIDTELQMRALESVAQAQLVLAAALELTGPFERKVV